MKIYTDLVSGDELFSDAYPMQEVDDLVYEVESKMIVKSEGNYDIGANASQDPDAEKEDDGFDSTQQTVCNVLDAQHLQQTAFDKKSYMTYIKGYMKKLVDQLKEDGKEARVAGFQKAAQEFVKKVLAKFDDYEFYTGEKMEPEAMVILKFYKGESHAPFFYFFKDGLREEKV